jgi:DNA-binding beta-propeller fold protein YncE
MSTRFLKFALVVGFVLVSLCLLGAGADRLQRPIALDRIGAGDLYVLEASGAITRIALSAKGFVFKGSFALPANAYPTDVVSAQLFKRPTLLISSNDQKAGFVSEYSLEGRLVHWWAFRNGIAGLDVDPESHIVYVASSDAPDVFQIPLHPSKQALPSFAGTVLGARRLGPLICDVAKARLLLGDVGSGQLFELDLKTRKSRVLASDFGSPQALLISPASNVLYVADASRKKIYVIDLKEARAVPKVFAALPEFRSPSGLAKLEDGRLIVSDDEAGALFLLSKAGALQSTFGH